MNDVVFRLLRELPDTDKDRYDIAFERGRAQARSSLLFGGMTIGTLFTLFVVPSVYVLIAKDHSHEREQRAFDEAQREGDGVAPAPA